MTDKTYATIGRIAIIAGVMIMLLGTALLLTKGDVINYITVSGGGIAAMNGKTMLNRATK